MGCDRFVRWKTKRRPTRDDLQVLLEDYFGGMATEVKWREENGRFFVILVGAPSHALRRQSGMSEIALKGRALDSVEDDGSPRPRFIELFIHDDSIDIITRRGDEATNALAKGLAELCARFWQGQLEPD